MGECPSGFNVPDFSVPTSEVQNGLDRVNTVADEAIDRIAVLSDDGFQIASWSTDVPTFNGIDIESLSILQAPIALPTSLIDYDASAGVEPVGDLGNFDIYDPDFNSAPRFSARSPIIIPPTAPAQLNIARPTGKPIQTSITIPDSPDIDSLFPAVPTIDELRNVEITPISLPTFDGVKPVADIVKPSRVFNYNEIDYQNDLKDQVEGWLSTTLLGGTGLPVAIWDDIKNKMLNDIEDEHNRNFEDVTYEFAGRGFTTPPGAMTKRLRRNSDQSYRGRAAAHRDVMIQQATMEVDQLKFYTERALGYVQIDIGLYNEVQNRRLRAAEALASYEREYLNVEIALFNAQLQAYVTDAQVHRDLLEAAKINLDYKRLEIEVELARGENNKNKIDVYVAQLEAVKRYVEIYNSEIQATAQLVELDRNKFLAYEAEVNAYAKEVEAAGVEWDIYKTKWDGELAKIGVFQAETQAYAARIEGYGAETRAEQVKVDASLGKNRLQLDSYLASIERRLGEIRGNADGIQARATGFAAYSDAYRSYSSYNSSKADAYRSQLTAEIENQRAIISSGIEAARIKSAEITAQQSLAERAWEAVMTVNGQIGSAALSAYNVSASISQSHGYSAGQSIGCSETFTTNTTVSK
jgi:hypothetical protein